jgi:hypothetical protein
LKLGHLVVEVNDAAGQPVAPESIFANAYPANHPEQSFAHSYVTNPLDLALQAGVVYTVEIKLNGNETLVLTGQQVGEGEIRQMKVSASDFK